MLYWFCHTLTWICHGCTWVPNPKPLSLYCFFLELFLSHRIGFGSSCFHCCLSLDRFWFFLWLLQWFIGHLVTFYLASMCLCFLQLFFPLQLISNLIVLCLKEILNIISILLNLLRLDSWPKMWLSWRMFHVPLTIISSNIFQALSPFLPLLGSI